MTRPGRKRLLIPLCALSVVIAVAATAQEGASTTDEPPGTLLERGRVIYTRYCIGCHGEKGDGEGPAAARLLVPPRDFTAGIFKFRSTRNGQLPLEDDLFRTITHGVKRTSMSGFPLVPARDRRAVIEYLKRFSQRWQDPEEERTRVAIPERPTNLDEPAMARRGRLVYAALGCFACHGKFGKGDGPSSAGMQDNWGHPIRPFDFTQGALKSGGEPEDIYRTFHTGLDGTPMPDYSDSVAYIHRDRLVTNAAAQGAFTQDELERYRDVIGQMPSRQELDKRLADPDEARHITEQRSWELVAYILTLRQAQRRADVPGGGGS